MKVLVIGGCGYIGSHLVSRLLTNGHNVLIIDDLSSGYADSALGGEIQVGDFGDRKLLDLVFTKNNLDGVVHFASLIQVSESVVDPAKYYYTNVSKTLTLLQAMKDHNVGPLIFSSTAAVFGEPVDIPITEVHPTSPLNPYGASKLMVEQMLRDFDLAYGFRSVSLRYFNAAGADPEARIGERHEPETHLIPIALQAAMGKRPALKVFGRDYDTCDGTCVRDYIHVDDLACAHLLALEYLNKGGQTTAFNLGNGEGFSVQQVLETIEKVTGLQVPTIDAPRRDGDPARLVADASAARKYLGWRPNYSELETIIQHAWAWEQKRSGPT
ncbi:MAG: UDP-glucose 4-epimerase GalE [Pseudohongiella sp.]|uniref:UDP-glucose 4-epimerase GalE n=1 Tax=Pseudohongiella sp. TaxID=1979412 RepID=UPI0034A00206